MHWVDAWLNGHIEHVEYGVFALTKVEWPLQLRVHIMIENKILEGALRIEIENVGKASSSHCDLWERTSHTIHVQYVCYVFNIFMST